MANKPFHFFFCVFFMLFKSQAHRCCPRLVKGFPRFREVLWGEKMASSSRWVLAAVAVSAVAGYAPAAIMSSPARSMRMASARTAAPSMGVPKFFRWLTERFPQINRRISEGRRADEYVDNFYLDMNGIIHTCTHGDDIRPGEALSEAQMLEKIFVYTERLIRLAKPRKLCYLAIDGVAPRAKMNQQRSRRYRAPREAAQQGMRTRQRRGQTCRHTHATCTLRVPVPFVRAPCAAALLARNGGGPPAGPTFDSNCITPGTEFLADLGEKYKEWIERSKADPNSNWCHPELTVVFSGSDVVGEGEHKIMDFIRDGRADGSFDEDTVHCMYGLDADLIMLSMVSHAPKFCLLRERQKFQKGRYAPRGRKANTDIRDSADVAAVEEDNRDFVFLEIEMLRTLMAGTLRPRADYQASAAEEAAEEGAYSDERLVDDFVFMCMLVGNDFIPGMPHLDVADGALNLMLRAQASTQTLPRTLGTRYRPRHRHLMVSNPAHAVLRRYIHGSPADTRLPHGQAHTEHARLRGVCSHSLLPRAHRLREEASTRCWRRWWWRALLASRRARPWFGGGISSVVVRPTRIQARVLSAEDWPAPEGR